MRIYAPCITSNSVLQLDAEQAAHAIRVMRMKVGQACELFDGAGNVAAARIDSINKSAILVLVDQVRFKPKVLPGKLTLVIGLPKGDRQRSCIERATELGVHFLQPLACEFGVAKATEKAIERAERTVIESCKQCGRNQLMQVVAAQTAIDYFTRDDDLQSLKLICQPSEQQSVAPKLEAVQHLRSEYASTNVSIQIAIGPEGGFSDREVSVALSHGWQSLDLGPRILRVETALTSAITLASLLL